MDSCVYYEFLSWVSDSNIFINIYINSTVECGMSSSDTVKFAEWTQALIYSDVNTYTRLC